MILRKKPDRILNQRKKWGKMEKAGEIVECSYKNEPGREKGKTKSKPNPKK